MWFKEILLYNIIIKWNFRKKIFLNTKEILTLIKSDYTNEKASIISKRLIDYCFVTNDVLYVLHDNVTYEKVDGKIDKQILYYTSLLIEQSFKKIYTKISMKLKNITQKFIKTFLKTQILNHIIHN